MFDKNELIVNSSYKDFFLTPDNMRRDVFIDPQIDDLENLENAHLTRSLALFLKNIDKNQSVLYGIEIKSNGSDRSSRIPLVRYSKDSVSIWKIASGIESVEKATTVLNDLFYFLKEHSNNLYILPKKVLVLKDNESLFCDDNSKYKYFIEKIITKNDIILFSFDFLKNFIEKNNQIDFEQIFINPNKYIYTTLDL